MNSVALPPQSNLGGGLTPWPSLCRTMREDSATAFFIQFCSARRSISIPTGAGSEPELIDIDDATEAIGVEPDIDDFGDIIEPCEKNPNGHCEYSMADGFTRCVHCGRKSES